QLISRPPAERLLRGRAGPGRGELGQGAQLHSLGDAHHPPAQGQVPFQCVLIPLVHDRGEVQFQVGVGVPVHPEPAFRLDDVDVVHTFYYSITVGPGARERTNTSPHSSVAVTSNSHLGPNSRIADQPPPSPTPLAADPPDRAGSRPGGPTPPPPNPIATDAAALAEREPYQDPEGAALGRE